jgi:hypothetical protein
MPRRAFERVLFDEATGDDEVFRQLVFARIIEPTSKLDSIRVLEESGLASSSYVTMKRHLALAGMEAPAGWFEGRTFGTVISGNRRPVAVRGIRLHQRSLPAATL